MLLRSRWSWSDRRVGVHDSACAHRHEKTCCRPSCRLLERRRPTSPLASATMRVFILCSTAALVLSEGFLTAAEPNNDFFFKRGDSIVFLGDSISEQYQYSSYIELYLTTRFPN